MLQPLITLLTDFGTRDTYVGQVKGVIASIAPHARVIDLTHDVPAQDVLVGAILLDGAVSAFPPGAIHLAVVDPGVGGRRRPVAVQTERFTLVGPDNGLFTAVLERHAPQRVAELSNPAYHRQPVSDTFHGRDIFAPAAAHLALGATLDQLGQILQPHVLTRLDLPQPIQHENALELHVLYADHWGNLITDLTAQRFAFWGVPREQVVVQAGDCRIVGIRRTFCDVAAGEPVAYFGSSGRLEIAIRNGSFAQSHSCGRGDRILLTRSSL
ncbi:MAG TPA: SAM-dependent chlorinase/fluorinase [Phycisphaeraceae bacterium]